VVQPTRRLRSGAQPPGSWPAILGTRRNAGRGWEEDHWYWNSVYADAPVLNVHEHAKTLVEWRERLFLG
jgi:hypothetical protein